MTKATVLLFAPLLWGQVALAQDDDVPAPSSRRVVSHGASTDTSLDDDLAQPGSTVPPAPAPAAVKRSEPVKVVRPSAPVGSDPNDDLLLSGPPKVSPKVSPAGQPARPPPAKAAKAAKGSKKGKGFAAAPADPHKAPPVTADDFGDPPPRGSHVIRKSTARDTSSDSSGGDPSEGEELATPHHKATHDVPAAPTRAQAASPDSFSFELMPEEKKMSTSEQLRLGNQVDTRRSMLQWHQGMGITTTALMAATVVLGQLSYSDRFGGGASTGQFEIWHSTFEAATVLAFTGAGLLAILAPVPYEKKSSGVDTITVHKYSMLVATIGMATEVPLGIYTVAREGYTDQATLALVHLVLGYVTAAALGTGTTALFF